MRFRETEKVKLKAIAQEDIEKEIIAFANCYGGTVYVGVADNGEILGTEKADECILKVSNMVRNAIKPDITMCIHYEILNCEGKEIVAVNVQRGIKRPYYLAKNGLCSEGVYVRQEYSSVPAADIMIRQMIKEIDGDSFEEMRSINQALMFKEAKKEFELRKIAFGRSQMKTLKLISAEGLYTNLGLLLSEQCFHTIKITVFDGTNQNELKDRREFSGSLLQQMNEVYEYVEFRNQPNVTSDKFLRIDTRDYPEVAVREALLNSLIHRDYSFRASTLIRIYADRIEFVTPGGLFPGLELADLMIGVSVCRNPQLANVFYHLQLIEVYGTGMKRIFGAYEGESVQPKIEVSNNVFKIVLPNRNAARSAAKGFRLAGKGVV